MQGPPNDALNRAMGLSMNSALSQSARSVDGYSTDGDSRLADLSQQQPQVGNLSMSDYRASSASGVTFEGNEKNTQQLLRALLQQNREISNSIRMLASTYLSLSVPHS